MGTLGPTHKGNVNRGYPSRADKEGKGKDEQYYVRMLHIGQSQQVYITQVKGTYQAGTIRSDMK